MYEVEVKVRADHDAVRERLAELDAHHLGTVVQEDTYYNAPHRDFGETDEALRVRRVTDLDGENGRPPEVPTEDLLSQDADSRLTYKGPLVDSASKTREEIESEVVGGTEIRTILDRLGFEVVATVRKVRERYDLDGYTVTLDSVDDLGEFLEVEIEATESDVERAREGVFDVLARLGFDPDSTTRTSYLELLLSNGSPDL